MCMKAVIRSQAVGIDMVKPAGGFFKTRSDIFGVEKMPLRAWDRRHRHRKVSFPRPKILPYVTCLDSYFYARFATPNATV